MSRSDGTNDLSGIVDEYEKKCNTSSDINELLPILKEYAQGCSHVTELGTRGVRSTWALLAGNPGTLITYDIIYRPEIESAAIRHVVHVDATHYPE